MTVPLAPFSRSSDAWLCFSQIQRFFASGTIMAALRELKAVVLERIGITCTSAIHEYSMSGL